MIKGKLGPLGPLHEGSLVNAVAVAELLPEHAQFDSPDRHAHTGDDLSHWAPNRIFMEARTQGAHGTPLREVCARVCITCFHESFHTNTHTHTHTHTHNTHNTHTTHTRTHNTNTQQPRE
jgi:hypothetical protein